MALSSAELDTLIESARSALATALASPKPNYSIGGKRVDYADYIKTLREQLRELVAMQADIPSEQVRAFDSDITDTGEDNTEEEGDESV